MADRAKDAGLMGLISGILGATRTEEPPAEAAPPAPTSAPATPAPPPEMEAALQQKSMVPAAPRTKPLISLGGLDEKRARLPAVAVGDLVLGELRKVDGFPRSGVSITIYGYRNWNAMIRFAPFSTTLQNAARLREALPDIVHRLRQYVELET